MWWSSWGSAFKTAALSVLAYGSLVLFLRVSGKRTLSKLNAFDLVVTVALGSTLATIPLSRDISLADGLVAMASLVSLQFIVAWSSARYPFMRRMAKDRPTLLYHNGAFLRDALKEERVNEEEVYAAMREQGHGDPGEISAVVLETDGSISVISRLPERGVILTQVKHAGGAG